MSSAQDTHTEMGDAEAADLPIVRRPKHSPSTTAWEPRTERETLGLERCDRVRPLKQLANGSFDDDRVHCRGRIWHRHDHPRDDGGTVKLAGEVGSLRVDVDDQDHMDALTDDCAVLIKGLRADGERFSREFVIDEQSELLTWDKQSRQRTALMELAHVDRWPVRKRVDATEDEIRLALEERAERLRDDLAGYGNVSVGVRYRGDRWQRQQHLAISFDQLLLPHDILYVYRTIAGIDGINWIHDSGRGTYLRGIRYESEGALR